MFNLEALGLLVLCALPVVAVANENMLPNPVFPAEAEAQQQAQVIPQYQYPPMPQATYPNTASYYPSPYTLGSYPNWYYPTPYGQARGLPYNAAPAMPRPVPKKQKPWGDTRYIWPDFYTDFTDNWWDKMINAPYDMGYMPGGWRFPSLSSPDPVTVGDAITNQFPPMMEEVPNFMNFNN